MTSTTSLSDSQTILEVIDRLRSCSQVQIQTDWHCWEAQEVPFDWLACPAPLNSKGHIVWSAGQVLWLGQKLVIPQTLQGYPVSGLALRLALTWWAKEAEIFVNGDLVAVGDLFDHSTRVLLSNSVVPGEEITVTLRLISPGHSEGALMRSLCLYETEYDRLDLGFVADELAILHQSIASNPEKLAAMVVAVARIDWSRLNERQEFERSLFEVRSKLQDLSNVKQYQLELLGHAHLDLAWFWSVDETWEVAQRTFESALKLQQEFSGLTFCHSTPALYAWIESHCQDLFAAIQQQIETGRWEVVGGLWVEPDLNLINGESIVRQVLYAQRYVQQKFGRISTVAWLPDTFGFCATLPQIFKQGGIEYFVTQKLRWNDTTEFPYGAFWWRSPDGTELFSLMSAPIGEGIDPLKMTSYVDEWEKQTNLKTALWLPGVGDHGGGPTRDMLEVAQRWQQSPFFPQLQFTTAEKYLKQIREELPTLPVWEDELYLEFHRGCYTTHATQKRWNRRCEELLYQAELFAALATKSCGVDYPQAQLETAWKQVLFNQFHDILPGSSVTQVFVDANQAWQEVNQVGTEILQQSFKAIAAQISLPMPPQPDALPMVIFNSLNWQRSEVVTVPLPTSVRQWQVYNLEGVSLPTQVQASTLLFLATDIPAVGYRVFWLCSQDYIEPESGKDQPDEILENEFLRVIVDCNTGDLSSVFDKVNHREVLAGGNQLQAFQDTGQYWDAWNIDPNYTQHPLPPTKLKSIQWIHGSLQTTVRVVRQLGRSEFCQDYILEAGSPLLKIVTTVDWQERQVLVKAAFLLNLAADYATYEIPCGAICRSTKPNTPAEQAKWEVPALRWADISNDGYGVSLLNDCKYGYDSKPDQLRLTLLRSSSWPDPEADRGVHHFTYALYPHSGSWQSAHTVRRGYELNLPLQVMLLPTISSSKLAQLPAFSSLLNLSADNLILMAFKQSDDNSHNWILRCYECHGELAQLDLQSDLGLVLLQPVNLLEQPIERLTTMAEPQIFELDPWKIASFSVE